MKSIISCIIPILFLLFSCGSNRKDTYKPQNRLVELQNEASKAIEKRHFTVRQLDIKGIAPTFFHEDQFILFSKSNYIGLWLYDLKTKEETQISDARGAGYQPITIGNKVLYTVKSKESTYELFELNQERLRSFKNKDEAILQLLDFSRNDVKVATIADDLNSIVVRSNKGGPTRMSPGDFQLYLNASLSPDGNNLLFEVSGKGGYIADLQGKILKQIQGIDHPGWIDNDHILYLKVVDDGSKTTSGEVFIYNIKDDEAYSVSSDYDGIIEFASADKNGKNIIASTIEGDLILFSRK